MASKKLAWMSMGFRIPPRSCLRRRSGIVKSLRRKMLDSHNCGWLMRYPNEALAGGSMYAVHLHSQIPTPGRPGGPPLPSAFRQFGGAPIDIQGLFVHLNKHPEI